MSVVLYKNDGQTKRMACDSLSVRGDLTYKVDKKITKFGGDIYIGSVGRADFCDYVKSNLSLYPGQSATSLRENMITVTEKYGGGENADAEFIIAVRGKVFYVGIDKGMVKICSDITDRDIYGIGYADVAIGAILAGLGLKEAIELAATRVHNISGPAYEYIVDQVKE